MRLPEVKPAMQVIAIFFFVQLIASLIVPVWGSSEAREAHVIWSILHNHEWLLPLRNGIIPSKPPLFHWFGSVVGFVFSSTAVWVPRLISLISAVGVLWLTGRITRCFFQTFANEQKKTGVSLEKMTTGPEVTVSEDTAVLLSTVILATSWLFFAQSTDAKVDMHLCWWTTLAVTCLLLDWNALIFAGAAAAAILTKGPVGIAAIGLFCLIIFLVDKEKRRPSIFFPYFFAGVAGVGVAGIWYWYARKAGGEAFLQRHLFVENLIRIAGGQEWMNEEAWWFYLSSIHRTLFPWIFVLYVVIINRIRTKVFFPGRTVNIGLYFFAALLLLMSCAAGKRHSYLLPAAPFFSASLAVLVMFQPILSFFRNERRILRVGFAAVALLSIGTTAGLTVKARSKNYSEIAAQVQTLVKDSPLICVKQWWDESFDVVMYLMHREITVATEVPRTEATKDAFCMGKFGEGSGDNHEGLRFEKPSEFSVMRCDAVDDRRLKERHRNK